MTARRTGTRTRRRSRQLATTICVAVTVVILTAFALIAATANPRRTAGPEVPQLPVSSLSIPPSPTTLSSSAAPVAAIPAAEPWLSPISDSTPGNLRPGSDPSALPAPVLIVDKLNNRLIVVDPQGRIRWQFPQPGDLAPGETFHIPDDAFFSPDGRYIVATQEDQDVISLIDIAAHHIVYRYGVPGQPRLTANHLNHPDDAMALPNGDIITADIQNCRLMIIGPGAHVPLHVIGLTTTSCRHAPPSRWGSPNGVFPLTNGHYLVTEINGDWVDEIGLNGTVYWSAHPPHVSYPSDSTQIGPDTYLTVDYSRQGQVVTFNRQGTPLWSYRGTGPDTLNHPSLAHALPNGDIILNDDYNHRIIIIDPHTNTIVWQYGVTGVAGSAPGYLNNPDGLDLVPPNSLLVAQSNTLGTWP
jgi:hypothetical protein